MSMSGDSWYVKLSDGDVHRVTLDQLDEAFQAGHIDADTMVLASGATEWTKLGDLAGIGDSGSDDDVSDEDVAASAPPASQAPSQAAQGYAAQLAYQTSNAYAAQPAAVSHAGYGAPAVQQQQAQPAYAAAPQAVAGYVPQVQHSPSYAPPSYGHATSAPPSYTPRTPVPNSLRPMSMDFGELDDEPFKKKSGKKWVPAVLALALFGGAGSVAVQRPSWAQPILNRVGLHSAEETATPAVAPPAPPPPPAPVADPTPPPVAATPQPSLPVAPSQGVSSDSPLSPHFTDRATDPAKISSASDSPKGKGAAKGKGHGGSAGAGPARAASPGGKGKSSVFTTGGNKFDPLNSSI